MPENTPEFEALLGHYPEIIAAMPTVFTSHQFILTLAQRYQRPYIELLYHYRNNDDGPFRNAHQKIAKGLDRFPELLTKGARVTSEDIFGHSVSAREWKKSSNNAA